MKIVMKELRDELEEVTVVAFAKQKRECNRFYSDCKTCGAENTQ